MDHRPSSRRPDPKSVGASCEPWRTLASEYVIEDAPWLTLRRDRVGLPRNKIIDGYWVIEQPPWANVVALTEADDVVLVRQFRHAIGREGLEIPGGYVGEESPLEAAQRELLEETGYGGGRWNELLTMAPNPALQNNMLHCFLASGVRLLGPPTPDETEHLLVELHHQRDIVGLIRAGEIHHALHVAPLLAFVLGRAARGFESFIGVAGGDVPPTDVTRNSKDEAGAAFEGLHTRKPRRGSRRRSK